MQNLGTPRPKKRLSICCVAWLVVFAIIFVFYIYKWVQFDHRVRLFNTKIQIGMTELEVHAYLGPPSLYSTDLDDIDDKKFVLKAKKYDEFAYTGTYFGRDDLVLYFDSESKRLVHKERLH